MGRYSGIYYKPDSVKKCYSEFYFLTLITTPETLPPRRVFRFTGFQK